MDTIEGLIQTPTKKIENDQGMIMHMMRKDSEIFQNFGEIYFSLTYPGVVKGWTCHKQMTQNYAVPSGELKVVLYDGRQDSQTYGKINEILVGRNNYQILTIPPGVWYSFTPLNKKEAMIANCTDLPHSEGESSKLPIDTSEIPYSW